MGNAKSSSASIQCAAEEASLAMMAVSRNCFLEKAQIISLRNAMTAFSDAFGMIKREGFDQALDLANLSNVEIFDLLFTMWDNKGDEKVSSKEFCIGISLLACPFDNTPTIINFALQVSDDLKRGYIEIQELHELLTGINSTASYFGDFHLTPEDIDTIVEVVFEKEDAEITHGDCIRMISMNPYVKRFASGRVRMRVQFKKDLVMEYIYDNINDSQPLASIVKENDYIQSDNLYDDNAAANSQQLVVTSLLDETESWESASSCSVVESVKILDPPSVHSYSTYQQHRTMDIIRKSKDPPTKTVDHRSSIAIDSIHKSRDPPTIMVDHKPRNLPIIMNE